MAADPVHSFTILVGDESVAADLVALGIIEQWHGAMLSFVPSVASEDDFVRISCRASHILLGDQVIAPESFEARCMCGRTSTATTWVEHVPGTYGNSVLLFIQRDTGELAYTVKTLKYLERLTRLDQFGHTTRQVVRRLYLVVARHVITLFCGPQVLVNEAYMEYIVAHGLVHGPDAAERDYLTKRISHVLGVKVLWRQYEDGVYIPRLQQPPFLLPDTQYHPELHLTLDHLWVIHSWMTKVIELARDLHLAGPPPKYRVTSLLFTDQIRKDALLSDQYFCGKCARWFKRWGSHYCGEWVKVKFRLRSGVLGTTATGLASLRDILPVLRKHRNIAGVKEMWYAVTKHTLELARYRVIGTDMFGSLLENQLLDGDAFNALVLQEVSAQAAAVT